MSRTFLLSFTALSLSACMTAPALQEGSLYVAMGSSFAAGPGIPSYYEDPPTPCARSTNNYAHQLASRRNLTLIDVSCSGATTGHLTGLRPVTHGPSIPPQLDALTPDVALVTITIGGNDLGYIGRLTATSCAGLMQQTGVAATCNAAPALPTEQAYAALTSQMDFIAKEVRRRSPNAQLVFVDYLAVLPESGTCAATPLSPAEADIAREIARRLAAITRKAAGDNGASIITASEFSKGHDACSTDPWMNGYPRPDAPVNGTLYHPNAKGMTAVADALEKLLH
jgi:lysophospholipase L1-like esterase